MYQPQVPADVVWPPTDLWSDEPPMESDWHRKQMQLLIDALESQWHDRQDFYCSGNLTVYYSLTQCKSEDFRGPDFFVVLGCERRERRSWTVWEEGGRLPNVIVEILSDSTAEIDRGLKKQIYQDVLRVPEYFWFDPQSGELCGFHLIEGRYEPLEANEQGWLWSAQLGLYFGVEAGRLRLISGEGAVIPTPAERAQQERERAEAAERQAQAESLRAEQEKQRAEQAEAQAQRLAERLRALGIDPQT
ncbi:Uma2 family endonuclease [Gloeobacter morelensis]|uniref:Uma2 family endonuclease n=1 Tax=Gloeobacter morelensis TaxID=2907343 RepID=UPI001E58B911|nr:Uma2 family endonuclease [Gloeobacter morelensis]